MNIAVYRLCDLQRLLGPLDDLTLIAPHAHTAGFHPTPQRVWRTSQETI